ncbi:MAG TPA: hypothetical protein VL027_09950 [Spongiibacteraceae bacterium]|jgi:cell division inhibitor SulA|nr:hypothetical protein [Spongiibacteraceae bacterium]HUH38253.1 hypothetical protein [Spongiibacteraceae bacterium]
MQLAIDYPEKDYSAHVYPMQAADATPAPSRLSELIFPAAAVSADILASVVSQLSDSAERRWLTWIGRYPLRANKKTAACRMRRLNSEDPEHSLTWTLEALRNGTSHTVMTLIRQPLDESAIERLEIAAARGGSHCVLIRLKA